MIKNKIKNLWKIPIFKYTLVVHLLFFILSTILTLIFFRELNDFRVYYRAGEIALTNFKEIYNPAYYDWPFRYLPLAAFYFIPFSLMSFDFGFIIFNTLNLLLNVIIIIYLYKIWILIRREDHEKEEDRIILYICLFLLSLPQIFNYILGQINLYITFFIVYSLYLFIKSDQMKIQFIASLLLGISVLFKPITIFMFPFIILTHYNYDEKKFKLEFSKSVVRLIGALIPLAINAIFFFIFPALLHDFIAINITGETNTLVNYSFSITKLITNFSYLIGIPTSVLVQSQIYVMISILLILGGIGFFIFIFRRFSRFSIINGYSLGILIMLLAYFDSWDHHLLNLIPLLIIIIFNIPRKSKITRKYIKPSFFFFNFFDLLFIGLYLIVQNFFPFNFIPTIFLIISFLGVSIILLKK